jgi:lysophospholipase L1-like esterase
VEALLISKYRKLNQGRLDSFYSLIKELKQEYNLTFLQLNEIIPDDHYFMDPFHLNEEGAKKFSRNLAQKFLNLGVLKFH